MKRRGRRHLPLLAPVLPPMQCEKGCGECCGVVPVTAEDVKRVRAYVAEHKIVGLEHAHVVRCPYYQKSQCAIYPVRPRVCQAYGHSSAMVCPRGHNADVDAADERALQRWVIEGGAPVCTLHDVAMIPTGIGPVGLARVLAARRPA